MMTKKLSFMLSFLLMFNTVYSVGPLERQRDKDCRMYTCAALTFGLVMVGMAVGITCLENHQCFSRKPGSNDTIVNESTVQSSPASLNYPPTTRTVKPRRSSRG